MMLPSAERDFYLLRVVDRVRESGWELKQDSNKVRAIPPQSFRDLHGLTDRGFIAGDDIMEAVSFIEGFTEACRVFSISGGRLAKR